MHGLMGEWVDKHSWIVWWLSIWMDEWVVGLTGRW